MTKYHFVTINFSEFLFFNYFSIFRILNQTIAEIKMTWDEIFLCHPAVHGFHVKPTGKVFWHSFLFLLFFLELQWWHELVCESSLSQFDFGWHLCFPRRFLILPSEISHFSYIIIGSDKNLKFSVFRGNLPSFLIPNSSIYHRCFSRPPLFRSKNHLSIVLVFVMTEFEYWVGVSNPEQAHGGEQALRSWWPTRWGFCWNFFGFSRILTQVESWVFKYFFPPF